MKKIKPLLTACLMLIGLASAYSQERVKCVVFETQSKGNVECVLTLHPKLTQNNDVVTLTTDETIFEFTTSDLKKVYFTEDKFLYSLVYMLDGGIYNTYKHVAGASITPENLPQKTGYTFSGWVGLPEIMPEKDVTVTGTFVANKHKLTYIVDGEEYKSYEVDYGAAIAPEENPAKEGYKFSGWSEIPETMPDNDVTIKGSFTKGNYSLKYMIDGEVYKTYEMEFGATLVPEETPVRQGYTFSGWSGIPNTMPAKDLVVTGSFTVNKYTVIYIVDNKVFQKEELDYGAKIVPPSAPEKEGYEFSWEDYPATMPAEDVVVLGLYTTGINRVLHESKIKSGNEYFCISGLEVNEPVRVYNVAGEVILSCNASAKGDLTISISQLSNGVNIIKTKHQSFKVIRK